MVEWSEACDQAQIPWAPVNTMDDLFDDEHLKAVGFFEQSKHPSEGDTIVPRPPINFSKTPSAIHRHAPRHGEQSDEVLREAGFGDREIESLYASGAVCWEA